MRLLFSAATFVFSVAFVAYGLETLDLYDLNDRPGPGYFPLILGVLLLITTSLNVFKDFKIWRKLKADKELNNFVRKSHEPRYAKDTVVIIACLSFLVFTLDTLGAIFSMVLFCLAFLVYFNRGKYLQNLIYSIVFPASVYLLFDVWLQAGLPDGLLSAFY